MLNEVDDYLDLWMPDWCQVCLPGPMIVLGEVVCSCYLASIIVEPFVRPQRWQQEMLDGFPRGEATKASAVRIAKSRWPDIPISLKSDWGIADAALIAEWHRRHGAYNGRVANGR
jgi:hypothetical protein